MSSRKKQDRHGKRRGEMLWPRMIMKKWLNVNSNGDEFSADEHDDSIESESEHESEDIRSSKPYNGANRNQIFPEEKLGRPGGGLWRGQSVTLTSEYINREEYRIAVCTWNVAGKLPPSELELTDWLGTHEPADIYVIGFQEIVRLSAGNVFGSEDIGPTLKWQALIRDTLNKSKETSLKSHSLPTSPSRETESDSSDVLLNNGELDGEHILVDEETTYIDGRPPFSSKSQHDYVSEQPNIIKVYRCTERIDLPPTGIQITESETISSFKHNKDGKHLSTEQTLLQASEALNTHVRKGHIRYVRIASKQMVGVQISIWVRRKLRRSIKNLTVSCVGLGIMGCMGNKGSIAVSMELNETKFCFVCAHLASGDKEGDELRRNADVAEIIKRTRFPSTRTVDGEKSKTILNHDRIIWFGDLNYRINMSDSDTRSFVSNKNWTALLEKDQLKKELLRGGKFHGWQEGPISFAPTYKYKINSNQYSGENPISGEKRRAPAWCDRIIWYGKGLKQLSYRREELVLSDHRPLTAVFLAEVNILRENKLKKAVPFKLSEADIEALVSEPLNGDPQTRLNFKDWR